MQEILIKKLHAYIGHNNPDILYQLQSERNVTRYLTDKIEAIDTLLGQLISEGRPPYIIEELCLEVLTEDLRPSKCNYVMAILEEEFKETHQRLQEASILTNEVVNMVATCTPVFEMIGFSEETEGNPLLHYAITGALHEYLESKM